MDSKPQATRPGLPAAPPSYIKPISPFSPRERQCCQCQSSTPEHHHTTTAARQCACSHDLCASCPRLDGRGSSVIPHSFPSTWMCSTCDASHSVLEILAGTGEEHGVTCACGQPALQAVYDQFGRIFLFWRDDAAVRDLRDPAKVQEAAWRVWEAGAEPWLEDVLALEAEREREREKGRMRAGFYRRGSLSSADSMDVEMAAVECR